MLNPIRSSERNVQASLIHLMYASSENCSNWFQHLEEAAQVWNTDKNSDGNDDLCIELQLEADCCWADGRNREEVIENMRQAIYEYCQA